jgi:glycosyltransferase involved in cell wall biosynthesis
MTSIRVLYDGWPLVHDPYGPAAMHLQAILAHLPAQIEPFVALPGPAPAWLQNTPILLQPTGESYSGQLLWVQRRLSQFAQQAGAQILHITSPGAPLLGGLNCVVSPGGFEWVSPFPGPPAKAARARPQEKRPFAARLRLALGQGGLARARAIFWPEDLPDLNLPVPVVKLPPVVHPSFSQGLEEPVLPGIASPGSNGHPRLGIEHTANPGPDQQARMLAAYDVPEMYVLYHGPTNSHDLQRLLECWQWASGPIGDQYPLVILGLPESQAGALEEMVRQFDLGETVRSLQDVPVETLSAVYRGCAVCFHPAPLSPWGGPVRNALACGKPVVAAESRMADAIVGPAAYLAPGEDARSLGAALLTVIVEEEVGMELAKNARQRSNAWSSPAFGQALHAAYTRILS